MTMKTTKTFLTALSILLGIALVPSVSSAYAAQDCNDFWGFCVGTEELHSTVSFDTSGIKARVTIPDITTSANCDPNGVGFSLIGTWVFFPNGEWIEIGVNSGQIDGTCYDSEEYHYLVYQQDGEDYEFRLTGSVSPTDNIYYEISDTNNDNTWQAYAAGNQRASLIMDYDYGDIATGVESKDDDTSVPKTDIKYIQEHDGTDWDYWTTNDEEYDINEGFITQCTPSYQTVKVGVGGSETC